jgi:hypothetical protein
MKRLIPFLILPLLLLGGCAELTPRAVYDRPAYKPKDPSKVVVKVSLSKQMVYVMEGNRPLLVTANSQPEDATLGANFHRPEDYNDPDLPSALLTSQHYFEQLKAVILQ